jgi:Subunit 21 of Mediator complex
VCISQGCRCPGAGVSEQWITANQKELVTDLIVKAKQIEYLINSLPEPEPEEEQVR